MGAKKPPTLDNARDYYHGKAAARYEEQRTGKAKWRVEQRHFEAAIKEVRGGKVLDVPVGTGRFLEWYRHCGLEVVGVDYSNAMLAIARAAHPWAALEQGDVAALRFGDGEFDAVVCARLLHLVATHEVAPIMRELFRVAKSHVILTTYLDAKPYVSGRSQVHVYNDAVWSQPGWPPARPQLLLKSKGVPYYMLHYSR